MAIDIDRVRAETPGCATTVHLNNAGASLPPAVVLNTVVEYLEAEALIGAYEVADDRSEQLEAVNQSAATLFGGDPNNWAFDESATRAWNAAFTSLRFEPGDKVLTTRAEYPSNMAGLLRAHELHSVEIQIIPDDEHGQVDIDALESMLDDRVRLVSLTHVPTQGGLVNPAAQVGAILKDRPTLFQLDACQSVGQLPVNVEQIGCDIMSFTGRKFLRGPRGTGMVWANDTALSQMFLPAGVDMRGATWDAPMTMTPLKSGRLFEPYEVFYAGKVGLAAALNYAADIGVDSIAERNAELSAQLRAGLDQLAHVTLHDKGLEQCAIVTFTVDGIDSFEVLRRLRAMAINVSVAIAGSARLDFPDRHLDEVVRTSVHYYNNDADLKALIDAVAEMTDCPS